MADKDAKNGRNDAAGADVPVFASRRAGDKVATPVSDGAASEPVSGSAQSAVQADAASADMSATLERAQASEDGQNARLSDVTARPARLMPRRRGWLAWLGNGLFEVALLLALISAVALVTLSGRDIHLPNWMTERVVSRLDQDLPGAELSIDGLALRFSDLSTPRLQFKGVGLTLPAQADALPIELVRIPEMEIDVDRTAMLKGQFQPEGLRIAGARLVLSRDAEGAFDLGFGGAAQIGAPASLSELLARVDAAFQQPALASIDKISAEDITLELRDARADRVWLIERGKVVLSQNAQTVSIAASLALPDAAPDGPGAEDLVPEAHVTVSMPRGGQAASVSARLAHIPAREIAAQSPALAFLAPLDAPVSGMVRAELSEEDGVDSLSGKLEIGAGVLRAQVDPVPFNAARAYFSYDPERARLTFDDLRLSGPVVTFEGRGHAFVTGELAESRLPESLVAQLQGTRLTLDPEGVFETSAEFSDVAADVRITLDPFAVDVGQLTLVSTAGTAGASANDVAPPPTRLHASGYVRAVPEGWEAALDGNVETVRADAALDLWPMALAPRTRVWLTQALQEARLDDFRVALRVAPDVPLRREMTWRFDETVFSPLKEGFPPVREGAGYASLGSNGFTLSFEQGRVQAPEGGEGLDLSGSVFRVPVLGVRPAQGELDLKAEGDLVEMLSILDQAPLRLLRGVPEQTILADAGNVSLQANVSWPLRPKVKFEDTVVSVQAVLRDVVAERLVPGRTLTAEQLFLQADNALLTLSGPAQFSGVPVEGTFRRKIGPQGAGTPSIVDVTAELSDPALRAIGVTLPEGSVSGTGRADVRVEIPAKGQPPTFEVRSDLNRVELAIAPLGWTKPRNETGSLVVSGQLGAVPEIPEISLEVAGLSAEGAVQLDDAAAFESLTLDRFRLGGWIDAPVTVSSRGAGRAPAIAVRGGRIDLRRLGSGGGGNSYGSGGSPIALSLDRLTVSESIVLRNLRGDVTAGPRGLSGAFTASVNGSAAVRGQVAPDDNGNGTAIRVTGADAGAVLRAAGFFEKANGGELSLTLRPRGAKRSYDGRLEVKNTRVTSAPGLAALLNTVSVIGLLEQLNGPGLLFSTIDAEFVLSPDRIVLRSGAGFGPSLGVSMDGVYDLKADQLNMQGVLSPIYALNGIGQIFSVRRGEGLFGFSYQLSGPARDPRLVVNPLSILTPGAFRELFRRQSPATTD